MFKRYFHALDLDQALDRLYDSCHSCLSLKNTPEFLFKQSTSEPPDAIGISFAADVIKRYRQCIMVVRETVTSYTVSQIIPDEQKTTLRDAIICACTSLRATGGPQTIVRVDPAPGFSSLVNDSKLKEHGIIVEIGRIKNVNKNPVGEHAVREVGDEILRLNPDGNPISEATLAVATSNLNSRIRKRGLSSREMFFQRDQFTNDQLPISDRELIQDQHMSRLKNHPYSEKSKNPNLRKAPDTTVEVGDLVYLYQDRDKCKSRPRYLVVSVEDQWCQIKKFTGHHLRSSSYKVKLSECFKVPNYFTEHTHLSYNCRGDDDPESDDELPVTQTHQAYIPPPVPPELSSPYVPTPLLPSPEDDINGPPFYDDESDSVSDVDIHEPYILPRRSKRVSRPPDRYGQNIYDK